MFMRLTLLPLSVHAYAYALQALSSFGNFQSSMTQMVSNKLARYVMVAWGRANRQTPAAQKDAKRVISSPQADTTA
jgi:hypothetical protein